jgi:LmbE family N-acetylglucosaminyl deacetylase
MLPPGNNGTKRPPDGRLRDYAEYFLSVTSTSLAGNELRRSAIVFSPHPDDESLGCGGTILAKTKINASVKLVYLTDGSASHTLIPGQELKAIRRNEALNASRILGVTDTYFLDFEDRKLSECLAPAIDRVEEILRKEAPEEVFIPYCREPIRLAADHLAATKVVMAALRRRRADVTVWEYPVWFWLHWPWIGLRQSPPLGSRHVLWNSLFSWFGARAFLELKHSVYVGDVLEQKRTAIAQHRSQMEQLIPGSDWMTLGRVCRGEFLNCFYRDREFFRRYDYRGTDGTASSHS